MRLVHAWTSLVSGSGLVCARQGTDKCRLNRPETVASIFFTLTFGCASANYGVIYSERGHGQNRITWMRDRLRCIHEQVCARRFERN